MLRLPAFEYIAARTVAEAAEALSEHAGRATLIAGGTDLLPNMKRRQQTPPVLVGLSRVGELTHVNDGDGLTPSATAWPASRGRPFGIGRKDGSRVAGDLF